MEYIKKFINSYFYQKIKHNIFNSILNCSIIIAASLIVITQIEKDAYLSSLIKVKIFNTFLIICIFSFIFLMFKIIIHKYNLWNNSNHQDLAKELINKLPIKDRLINVLQIYAQYKPNDKYYDLTVKAIEDLKEDIKEIKIKNIKFYFPKIKIYILILLSAIFSSLIILSNEYNDAFTRIVNKNKDFIRPFPFKLKFNNLENNRSIFKGEQLEIIINGTGELPNYITLNWIIDDKIFIKNINKTNQLNYMHTFKNINKNMKIWADYSKKNVLGYKDYKIITDTLNIDVQERPEIKKLTIIIEPPDYTNINQLEHNQSITTIELLEGSKIILEGFSNKNLNEAKLNFNNDSTIYMELDSNRIYADFEVTEATNFEIICSDIYNNKSNKIKYFINIINDFPPYVNIKKPQNNFKINENYTIDLLINIIDDFGIHNATLEYYVLKPYYLNKDTVLNKISILNSNKNRLEHYINYNWKILDLNIGPGDEIFYWIKALDNNIKTGPGIGKSEVFRAYFPGLEELYFEVEQEQNVVEDTFEEMIESIDQIKNMYENVSNDVLKEQTNLEQQQETQKIVEELNEISQKIENLEQTMQTIEDLNDKNNLINEALGDKIKKLQEMFQDAIDSELMKAIEELQKSINNDDFEKSLEQLNKFDFEITDLEQQLDRMIELFEQVVAEQKLNEITKKMEVMQKLQENITEKINENSNNPNIDAMENKQNENLNNLLETLDDANKLMKNIDQEIAQDIEKLNNSSEINNIKNEIDNVLKRLDNNTSNMNQSSKNIENSIQNMSEQMQKIIDQYNQQATVEMLMMYTRIIKNLIDMSYEQEIIIQTSKNIKSKKDSKIKEITSKENIILQQYKSVFIQISDLSTKSFHITPEISKTFSQIFNYLVKAINGFEQGQINLAKKEQIKIIEYLNKTILLLINSMAEMQASGEASGYSQYLESIQQLTKGQQALNQGMGSLLPMPFGQSPGSDGIMQSLMQQQKQLMKKLENLLNEKSSMSNSDELGGLGKALDDMNEIIKDFESNNISEESIKRGERVYRKLLEHENSLKNRGVDDKWEAEQNKNEKLLDNTILNKNNYSTELKNLYKTLDEVDKNKNLEKNNKAIIQEYLRILIKEKVDEK